MRRIRPRLTYANVISTVALFLALSDGTRSFNAELSMTSLAPGARSLWIRP
jgi:hypothetical protein